VMDGKYQMVSHGRARTRYPGWSDSWPWYCQGVPRGCVRAVVATARQNQGWMVIVGGRNGAGLTMPDFARVLAQLGAVNVMGFDSNTHSDFWRNGAAPITAGGWEPPAPAATMLFAR
jgi:phosphodiester glycosidase